MCVLDGNTSNGNNAAGSIISGSQFHLYTDGVKEQGHSYISQEIYRAFIPSKMLRLDLGRRI